VVDVATHSLLARVQKQRFDGKIAKSRHYRRLVRLALKQENTMTTKEPLLRVSNLVLEFKTSGNQPLRALDMVNLDVFPGEVVGLVGESGSGKTVLSHTILGLVSDNALIKSGQVLWKGQNLVGLSDGEMRSIRGKQIAMIFQDAQASLNPVLTVASQLCHLLKLHRGMNRKDAEDEARRLLDIVRLSEPDRVLRSYAHQLSGGMAQRVMIAMALSCRPQLLIADEPTSALDVTIQTELVELLLDIRDQFSMSMVFITHDLGLAAHLCDRIVVMYRGQVVEEDTVSEIYKNPKHAYTQRLLGSIFVPDPAKRRNRKTTIIPNNMALNIEPVQAG
jgi:ABC-type dipeptide/oligopeptide/nickel transport system ATPase component